MATKSMIYLLWSKDGYVERDGSSSPDILEGVFSSIDEMNIALEKDWFNLPFDTREVSFSEETTELAEVVRKGYVGKSLYYEKRQLNKIC